MALANHFYQNLAGSYLFSEIAKRVNKYSAENPDKKIIRLGIGDVTKPLPPSVIAALHKAVDEQATAEGFRGYGPEQGYDFLRETIVNDCFAQFGFEKDEIFVSDGAKSDIGNFQELFDISCKVAITDPVYPVYADSNVMAGRAEAQKDGRFQGIIYLSCTSENNFVPELPKERPDIIYLCYPNNPTGTVLTKEQLKIWVDYARANESIILFDSAYEAFIRTPGIPHSIYEIEGAKECAVEFRSYSKIAGFTGLRCGYVVIPRNLSLKTKNGGSAALRDLWLRRQTTKYNGTPYVVQRAAQAVHGEQGKKEVKELIDAYLLNAKHIREGFANMGLTVYGGVDAPYVWLKLPINDSWKFFDELLNQVNIVGTPGQGFGLCGEGYFRLTAFGSYENTLEAVERLKKFKF
ncbi:LL-diaminopimelate aminotransferase [Taurinivorans muris]|jgi:LL-diaminopimelate aminotransferase|uniref:LL-diaminopimelate aminotransferase n=1 Tax=Taurinivorans muris TaxID=2787751 RepID=A0ABY5XZ25_9BACT|nr:LL-diaminopimelate aminotransferase [Desulfovibrionaceae bacterium LT0009]